MVEKTSTTEIKQLGVQRYEPERLSVRRKAVEEAGNGICVEMYAGQGVMRSALYEGHFSECITVDSDPMAKVRYHIPAMKYIKEWLPGVEETISLVDFDAYGGPHFEIHEFFKVRKDKDRGIVVVITDGLGLMLKRSVKKARLEERYLLKSSDLINKRYCWKQMSQMTMIMMNRIAEQYGMTCVPLAAIPGKGQNFLFSAWKLI